MQNPFLFSDDNKRYHTLYYDLRHKFKHRVFKAVLDAGFTCPNLDGTKGIKGCTYCLDGGAEFTGSSRVPILEQMQAERERIYKKHPQAFILAYFQAHTNTYAPLKQLRAIYEEALTAEGVCGLSIATRADALPPDILDYLQELSARTYLTVELGLQTIHDRTAARINRGHTYAEFLQGYTALKQRGIRVCVHLINGLPGETTEDMLETVRVIGKLSPDAIKLHLLHVLKGTVLEQEYQAGKVIPMEMQDYVELICRQLEYLPAETVIERLTGDGSKEKLIAPRWSTNKIAVLAAIDRTMVQWNTYQGKQFS